MTYPRQAPAREKFPRIGVADANEAEPNLEVQLQEGRVTPVAAHLLQATIATCLVEVSLKASRPVRGARLISIGMFLVEEARGMIGTGRGIGMMLSIGGIVIGIGRDRVIVIEGIGKEIEIGRESEKGKGKGIEM